VQSGREFVLNHLDTLAPHICAATTTATELHNRLRRYDRNCRRQHIWRRPLEPLSLSSCFEARTASFDITGHLLTSYGRHFEANGQAPQYLRTGTRQHDPDMKHGTRIECNLPSHHGEERPSCHASNRYVLSEKRVFLERRWHNSAMDNNGGREVFQCCLTELRHPCH
jgi:hypothetical protein